MIDTPRLRLRPFEDRDRADWAAMNADEEVMRYFPAVLSREASDAWLDKANEGWAKHGFGFAAVEREGALVGMCGLNVPGFEAFFTPAVEIGWRFARAHWGKGYATEAARAWLTHGFAALALDRIVAFAPYANAGSLGVMRRIGMERIGSFDHPKLPGSPLNPLELYQATKGDA